MGQLDGLLLILFLHSSVVELLSVVRLSGPVTAFGLRIVTAPHVMDPLCIKVLFWSCKINDFCSALIGVVSKISLDIGLEMVYRALYTKL